MTETARTFEDIVAEAAQRLVGVQFDEHGAFVSTPLSFPSGGGVVVWVDRAPPHFLVSDFGFALRECSLMGASRSQFGRRAGTIAEAAGVTLSLDGAFQVLVSEGQLEGAMKAISGCAHEIAVKFAYRTFQRQKADAGDIVHRRLQLLYGERAVARDYDIQGSSTTKWNIDLAVLRDGTAALLDVVTPWKQSVVSTLAKFGDIKLLENPPVRVAVTTTRGGFGTLITALAQNGHVIPAAANDDAYQSVVGARLSIP